MSEEIRSKLQEIAIRTFPNMKPEDVSFQKHRTQHENWDSLAHMQLVSEVESSFGVNFDMEEVVGITNLDDVVALVQKKKA